MKKMYDIVHSVMKGAEIKKKLKWLVNDPDGQFKFPHPWPPKFPRFWPLQNPPPELIGGRGQRSRTSHWIMLEAIE
jgi:hypothetical protein